MGLFNISFAVTRMYRWGGGWGYSIENSNSLECIGFFFFSYLIFDFCNKTFALQYSLTVLMLLIGGGGGGGVGML